MDFCLLDPEHDNCLWHRGFWTLDHLANSKRFIDGLMFASFNCFTSCLEYGFHILVSSFALLAFEWNSGWK